MSGRPQFEMSAIPLTIPRVARRPLVTPVLGPAEAARPVFQNTGIRAKRAIKARKNALAQHAWKPSDQAAWLTEKFYSEKVWPVPRRYVSICYCSSNLGLVLVCWPHPRGVSTASEALVSAGETGWYKKYTLVVVEVEECTLRH